MSVPNHFGIVQQVYASQPYDLSTKIGTGGFAIVDFAKALHAVDPHYGLLRKRPGQNQWPLQNGHAVDNVLYLSLIPGQSTAIDLVRASESTAASLWWSPDTPRYSAEDWIDPNTVAPFVLPPHSCKLGASMFWLVEGWRLYRSQVIQT